MHNNTLQLGILRLKLSVVRLKVGVLRLKLGVLQLKLGDIQLDLSKLHLFFQMEYRLLYMGLGCERSTTTRALHTVE